MRCGDRREHPPDSGGVFAHEFFVLEGEVEGVDDLRDLREGAVAEPEAGEKNVERAAVLMATAPARASCRPAFTRR